MYDRIAFDPSKEAPLVALRFYGGMRIIYHLMLQDPDVEGEILNEWRNPEEDPFKPEEEFSIGLTGDGLKFAGLCWHFYIYPNPDISSEEYTISIKITQEGQEIFNKEYENTVEKKVKIEKGDAVFVLS